MAVMDIIEEAIAPPEVDRWDGQLTPDSDRRDHTALVIIDVQRGSVTATTRHVVDPIIAIARRWSDEGRLVFLTSREREYETRSLRLVGGRREGWESDLVDNLAELNGYMVHRVERKGYSALTDELRTYLDLYVVGQVRVCGIDTERSVLASAVALLDGGFDPTVLAGLCASTGGVAAHRTGVANLKRVLGTSRVLDISSD
jgi:nicotinamidase-related amidase